MDYGHELNLGATDIGAIYDIISKKFLIGKAPSSLALKMLDSGWIRNWTIGTNSN
jgi:hypothetical protein